MALLSHQRFQAKQLLPNMNMTALFSSWTKKNIDPPHTLTEALAAARLLALKQTVADALRFLKHYPVKSLFQRQKLPWFLLLGSEGSGKTTLLAASGLGLVSTDNLPVQHIHSTPYCQWFFGQEAVFIDSSGGLMLPECPNTASLNLWKKFIRLLYRKHHFQPLDGLILCIDLLSLQEKTFEQQRQYVDLLRHHILAFPYPIPVYVLLTHCDRIQGFSEFFHTLSHEESEQICGLSLPLIDQQNFASHLQEQCNAFLARLSQQVITYLHRERSIEKRLRIKNFPLQLEAHRSTIIALCSQLHNTQKPIQGIYFTSSLQEGMQQDALSSLLDTFGFPAPPTPADLPLQKKPFFIKDTLKKIVQHRSNSGARKNSLWKKAIYSSRFYPLFASGYLLLVALMLTGYFYNQYAINQVQSLLSAYQNQSPAQAIPSLALLNTLKQGQDIVQYAHNPITGLLFHQAHYLKSRLDTLYKKALINSFSPWLEKTLTAQLQADLQTENPGLFNSLKIYLMMASHQHQDTRFIQEWFASQAHSIYAKDSTPDFLQHHLTAWLSQPTAAFATQPALITLAQNKLNNLPPSELMYANLAAKYQALHQENPTMPKNLLYTAPHFPRIMQQDIPMLVKRTLQDDSWVLEQTLPPALTSSLVSQLTQDVQQLYVSRYTEFWSMQSSRLSVPVFKNLTEAHLFASTFATPHSILVEPLNTIEKNLAPTATTPEGQKALAQLKKIRAILIHHQLNANTNQALQALIAYMDKIIRADNNAKAAFIAAQQRMRGQEKDDPIAQLMAASLEAPAPIDHWLNQLALHTWQTLLHTSQEYLNTLWQTEVWPKYTAQIAGRFPLNPIASADIKLPAFNAFFGSNGSMETFFQQNLADFVDTSVPYWQWKKLDGLHLTIPQDTLDAFKRASLIRKMYFANNEKKPNIRFSLMPNNMQWVSDALVLNTGEQTIRYATDFRHAKPINWPNQKAAYASLELQPQPGKKQILYEEKGDWAIFRLLAHARLTPSDNPKLYEVEFNINGNQVRYELTADSPINPFMPHLLTAFSCPALL